MLRPNRKTKPYLVPIDIDDWVADTAMSLSSRHVGAQSYLVKPLISAKFAYNRLVIAFISAMRG